MVVLRMYFRIYIRTKQYKYCTQTVIHKAHHKSKPPAGANHVIFYLPVYQKASSEDKTLQHFIICQSQVFQSPYNLTHLFCTGPGGSVWEGFRNDTLNSLHLADRAALRGVVLAPVANGHKAALNTVARLLPLAAPLWAAAGARGRPVSGEPAHVQSPGEEPAVGGRGGGGGGGGGSGGGGGVQVMPLQAVVEVDGEQAVRDRVQAGVEQAENEQHVCQRVGHSLLHVLWEQPVPQAQQIVGGPAHDEGRDDDDAHLQGPHAGFGDVVV